MAGDFCVSSPYVKYLCQAPSVVVKVVEAASKVVDAVIVVVVLERVAVVLISKNQPQIM